jgi:hypothetical protein
MLVVAFQNPVKALIERIVLSPKGRLTRDIATWGIDLGDAADKLQSECANIILATFVIPYLNRVYERKLFLLSCFKSPNIGDVTRKAHFGSRRETGYPTVWWKSSPKWHSVIQQTDAPTFAPLTRGRLMRPREGGEFGRESWPADQVERWPLTKLRLYNISQPTVSRIVAQHRKANP